MNARKIFNDHITFDVGEVMDFVRNEYHKLQMAIFSVMPVGCFLRMWKVLDLRMVFMLSPEMVEKKIVDQKDICTLCSAEDCPSNDIDRKVLRIIKINLLGNIYN